MVSFSGDRSVYKTGYNNGVAGTEVDIRSDNASLAYSTTAQALEIVSDNTADDNTPTGTLTLVNCVPLTAATGTVTLLGVLAADTVTINGLVYTAVAGVKANNTQFSIDGTDTVDAADLAASITADVRVGTLNDVTATNIGAVVTCTQTVGGTGGNATTLASSNGTRLALSGATFTGGLAADVATVNGLTYTGVAGVRANNTQFSTDGDDTANATDLKAAINADTRTPITVPTVDVIATSAAGVVTINAATGGTAGNTIDISGTSNITASGATLTDVSTGARTVLIEGLDGNYNEISETVNLNGTIVVDLVNSYLRVNNMSVVTAGTGLTNAGIITLRLDAAGATQAVIPAGDSVAHFTNYTIPARYKGEIVLIDTGIDVNGDNDVKLKVRDNGVTNASWQVKRIIRVTEDTSVQIFNNSELIFNEKSDIRFTSIRVTGADADRVNCNYTLVLHRQF